MKYSGGVIVIGKDGFPVEGIKGQPIRSFLRRWFLGHHKECEACWLNRQAKDSCDVMQNPSLIPGGPGFVGQEANQREATAKPNDASLIAAILEVAQLTDDTEDGGTVFMPDEEEWGIIVGLARERAKPKSEPK